MSSKPTRTRGPVLIVTVSSALMIGLILGGLIAYASGAAAMTVTATSVQTTTYTTTIETIGTYTVPVTEVSVGLMGCSISHTSCTLLVYSTALSSTVTIGHSEGCMELTYGTTSTAADGCTSSPSAVLSYGQWATVNATVSSIGANFTAGCSPCTPLVGEKLYGGIQIRVGIGNNTAFAPFAGVFTP